MFELRASPYLLENLVLSEISGSKFPGRSFFRSKFFRVEVLFGRSFFPDHSLFRVDVCSVEVFSVEVFSGLRSCSVEAFFRIEVFFVDEIFFGRSFFRSKFFSPTS